MFKTKYGHHGWKLRAGAMFMGATACLAAILAGCSSSPGDDGPIATPPPANDDIYREIEEADIIKIEDGFAYLANPYRGLRILDLRDPDNPSMRGGLNLGGRGVELFVRDNTVFVLTSADFFNCAGEAIGFESGEYAGIITPDFDGSRLWVVDVADKDDPQLVTQFDFDGFSTGSRRVGDVLYVAGNVTTNGADIDPNGQQAADDDQQDADAQAADDEDASDEVIADSRTGFVASINIANLEQVTLVDRLVMTAGPVDYLHITADVMYLIASDPDLATTTLVSYVDVSSPDGAIQLRDQFRVPGVVNNELLVDQQDEYFRIFTAESLYESRYSYGGTTLYVYDVSDPDRVERLARLPIASGARVRSARFDGDHALVAVEDYPDVLYTVDLSDAASPEQVGQLALDNVPVQIIALRDRVLLVGFDYYTARPAISLLDVSNLAQPRRLDQLIVTAEGGWEAGSSAYVDNRSVKVISSAELLLLPFSVYDNEEQQFLDYLQLIGYRGSNLTQQGTVLHRGLVRRAGIFNERLWVLSDVAFQITDILDPSEPLTLGNIEIISEQELLDAGLSDCVASARKEGQPISYYGWRGYGGCGAFDPALLVITVPLLCLARRRGAA